MRTKLRRLIPPPRDPSGEAHINALLERILANQEKIMASLDDTLAAVQAETTSENALVALVVGLKKQIDAAMGGQLTPSQQMRLDQIFNQVVANKKAVDDAVTANTEQPAGGIETQVNVTSSGNPANPGDAITLSAAVVSNPNTTPANAAPITGSITFNDGSNALGTAQVSNGTATLASSAFAGGNLAVGDHEIEAVYSGDANYASSTSDAFDQTIAAPAQAPAANQGQVSQQAPQGQQSGIQPANPQTAGANPQS
jgi:hypothetical protein